MDKVEVGKKLRGNQSGFLQLLNRRFASSFLAVVVAVSGLIAGFDLQRNFEISVSDRRRAYLPSGEKLILRVPSTASSREVAS